MSRNGSTPTSVVRFLEDFVVIIVIINRIAEKVFDSIFAAHITKTITQTTTTFIAKQDLYNLFIVFAKWCFGDCIIHLIPAKSFSLAELNGKKLLVDFFTKFWWKFLYGFQRCFHFGVYTCWCFFLITLFTLIWLEYSLNLADSFFSFLQVSLLIRKRVSVFLFYHVSEIISNLHHNILILLVFLCFVL